MRSFAFAACVFACVSLASERARAAGVDPNDFSERESFLDRRKGMMIGLTAWSAVSVAASAGALAWSDPPSKSYRHTFAGVTLAYAIINLGIAAGTLATIGSERESLSSGHLVETARAGSERLFVANVGLDMLYVAVGAALSSRGPTKAARGAGLAFLTQGGFLLGFDTLGAVLYR